MSLLFFSCWPWFFWPLERRLKNLNGMVVAVFVWAAVGAGESGKSLD